MPAPRITAEELKKRLDHETLTIIDVRQWEPYNESSIAISGSIRLDPNSDQEIQAWADTADKNRPVVTYCI